MVHQLIIIGSGPAGLTAGIYAARANLKPLIIDGSTPGGQLMGTTAVENWPGEQSILGPTLMKNIREHAQHLGCEFLQATITRADLATQPITLWTDKDKKLTTKALIIASGATPKRLGCLGEDEYWGKGVTTCTVCDGAFYKNQPVVIVGGGDTAMEDALFMTKFTNKITIVQIEDKLTASHAMQIRVKEHQDITIIYNSTVTKISGNGQRVTGATITNQKTNTSHNLQVDGVFIAIGHAPNTQAFKDQLDLTEYGHIKLTKHTLTSRQGVFAAGDVADARYRQAITSAGSGCAAALDVERYLGSSD
ncbi:thioredoxin-disulfide reductase [Candidatus Babeliales bacterium]|nr:thioredoxin-disulfide reductase [Candidatus Babeliales bacterium]